MSAPTFPDAWLAVIAEMHARRNLGLERYGKPVAAGDGEDYLQHLFEELLDALPYLTAFRDERRQLRAACEEHKAKWTEYEQKYILPTFQWAEEMGFDLRKLLADNPGQNCVELFFAQLKKRIADLESKL